MFNDYRQWGIPRPITTVQMNNNTLSGPEVWAARYSEDFPEDPGDFVLPSATSTFYGYGSTETEAIVDLLRATRREVRQ